MRLKVRLDLSRLGSIVRPTRIGKETPFRLGQVRLGIGVNPDVPNEDPEPTINWAASSNNGQAFVPFTSPAGSAAVVQFADHQVLANSDLSLSLGDPPTVGNVLVVMVCEDTDNGPTFTLTNGPWTQVGSTVYSGNGTNWPNRMYWRTVDPDTAATTTITSSANNASARLRGGIIELSGVDTLVDTGSKSNTSSTTDTVTPTASAPAILISATFGRNSSAPVLSPAGSMTEWVEISVGGHRPFGLNYQVIESASGSYTVGSTGASANSSMIAGAFESSGAETTFWLNAPLAIDGDDTSFEAVQQEQSPFLRHELEDSYLISSARLRVSWTSNTSRTITLQGGNEADYSDQTTLATYTYSPSGGLTNPDTLTFGWSAVNVYQFFQYLTSVENWYRVHESSLYQAGENSATSDFASVSSNSYALGGVVVQNAAASNYHFIASSPTEGWWIPHDAGGGSVSYGSNASHVAEISSVGAGTAVARFDHYHAGIAQITSSSSNTLQRGTVNLRPGSGIAYGLTDTDGDGEFDTLTITNTGSGGGGSDPTSSPGYEYDYAEVTSSTSITATTEATANTVVTANPVAFDGSTVIYVEVYSPSWRPGTDAAGRELRPCLYDDTGGGAASIGQIGLFVTSASGADGKGGTLRRRLTPSAATHTYSLRAFVNAGTGSISGGAGGSGAAMPAYIRLVRK